MVKQRKRNKYLDKEKSRHDREIRQTQADREKAEKGREILFGINSQTKVKRKFFRERESNT